MRSSTSGVYLVVEVSLSLSLWRDKSDEWVRLEGTGSESDNDSDTNSDNDSDSDSDTY